MTNIIGEQIWMLNKMEVMAEGLTKVKSQVELINSNNDLLSNTATATAEKPEPDIPVPTGWMTIDLTNASEFEVCNCRTEEL